ncbi:MAG: type IV secretory system conjugative DNA transfer family protein, partial [Planctomycetales bacterium]|nr:type IV secretory system conjugative DNA transfer family protein [Planctomycetales bacterium]
SSASYNASSNWAPQARRLLKPEEVMALSQREAITFIPGVLPIRTTLLRFYENKSLGLKPHWARRLVEATGVLILSTGVLLGAVILALATWLTAAEQQSWQGEPTRYEFNATGVEHPGGPGAVRRE